MPAYALAKSSLFTRILPSMPASRGFVNGDDPACARMAEQGLAEAWTLADAPGARHRVRDIVLQADGLHFLFESPLLPRPFEVRAPLIGRHNVHNLIAALLLASSIGPPLAELLPLTVSLPPPRGRTEPVPNPLGALVLVDFAHTPDGLEQVLAATAPLVGPTGVLSLVFGAGGDRDRGKRPEMGRVAGRLARRAIATSDNPRGEDPASIVEAVALGLRESGAVPLAGLPDSRAGNGFLCEVDRDLAIGRAVLALEPGDVLVIAGRGHETTQEVAGRHLPFLDQEVAARWLRRHPRSPELPPGFAFDGRQARAVCGGQLLVDGSWSRGLCTDSRRVAPGDLFVALSGERFDGNEYAAEAVRAGAAGVVCAQGRGAEAAREAATRGAWVLEVEDTLAALGDLALAHRRRFSLTVVGITGSVGKTSTRELCALALGGEVLANAGNHNNRIGVPQTLARLDASVRIGVIEMGTSEPGEIAALARMTAPVAAVITCIAEAHLERLGSLEGVAREKAALLQALPPSGLAVVPAGEALLRPWVQALTCRVVRFGEDGTADAGLIGEPATEALGQRFRALVCGQEVEVYLPVLGRHMVSNALAALGLAAALGVDVRAAAARLGGFVPLGQRMKASRLAALLVLEDCYNANPRSMQSALETLAGQPGPRVAVLGEMRELGPDAEGLHRRVGAVAAGSGLDLLIAVGARSDAYVQGAREAGLVAGRTLQVADPEAAAAALIAALPAGGSVLVKGSRGARMERVVEALKRRAEADNQEGGSGVPVAF
jgi:murE/murF fusion protein